MDKPVPSGVVFIGHQAGRSIDKGIGRVVRKGDGGQVVVPVHRQPGYDPIR